MAINGGCIVVQRPYLKYDTVSLTPIIPCLLFPQDLQHESIQMMGDKVTTSNYEMEGDTVPQSDGLDQGHMQSILSGATPLQW